MRIRSNSLAGSLTRSILGLALALPLAGAGCAGLTGDDDQTTCEGGKCDGIPDAPYPAVDTPAVLEIYAFDIWAQYLPPGAEISVTRDGQPVPTVGFPLLRAALEAPGTYTIRASAPEYRDFVATYHYDGSDDLAGMRIDSRPEARAAISSSHEARDVPNRGVRTIHTVYTGLSHKWFSPTGRPARRGNKIDLLMDGEEAWSRAYTDLNKATSTIHLSTWWWESKFELIRDAATHLTSTPTSREKNTILNILDRSPATKRVMVGQFWGQDGILSGQTIDDNMKSRGAAKGDNFEYMGQANETSGKYMWQPEAFVFGDRVRETHGHTSERRFDGEQPLESFVAPYTVDLTRWPVGIDIEHASYHQKFFVVDDAVAFIGGMNLRRVDWDTSEHKVFEPRRMLFDATSADRAEVANKAAEPDMGPRKDYVLRIEGPAAKDASDVFKRRWDLLRQEKVTYSENSSEITIVPGAASQPNGSMVQVTATLPDPISESAIAESWIQAVENATQYIYIEDQYFRAPLLNAAIQKRMREIPSLHLVVITKPVDEWLDPGCEWTYKSDALFRTEFPTRYHLFQLRAFDYAVTWGIDETDSFFTNMDVHSKMFIVDDTFMSVGSANKNNRGIVYEGEMNAAVFDPIFVKEQRRRILANILPVGVVPSDNSDVWIEDLDQAASWNDSVWDNWEEEGTDISLDGAPLPQMYDPDGFIYTLEFRTPDDCFIEGVGPDMT